MKKWKKDWTGFSFHVFLTKNILYQYMLISQIYVVSSSSFLMCPISSIFRVSYLSMVQVMLCKYVTGLKCYSYYHEYILLVSLCIFCCVIKRKYRHLFFDFAFYLTYQSPISLHISINDVGMWMECKKINIFCSAMILMWFISNEIFFSGKTESPKY